MLPDLTSYNCSEESPEIEDFTRSSDAPAPLARRARDYSGTVINLTARMLQRRGRVLTEADEPEGLAPVRRRSPWTDDHPSPRCVWRDYCEGARHYGCEALAIQAAYWAVAFIPCLLNMAFSAGHMLTQRPAYFWGTVVIGLLIAAFAH
jgi:hypothetical protein